jgi:putative heme-binding domain-containing protein
MIQHCFTALVAFTCLTTLATAQAPPHGLRLPVGFEVTEFAGSDLANDIFCMTLGPRGQVVVSGRGYIRLLVEKDGKAVEALEFAGAPKDGAMGLFWEGDDLYCMGDGGLRRYRNAGGEGRNKPPALLYPLKTGGEHDAHAIRRGPDGWLYVLCGNNTGIKAANASLPTSPIKEPVAGCVLRFPPDFKGCEIVADGFRNAYGFDFNPDGEWFTYDSDNERCVSLPWYEGTRLYHVVPGGHYGWQNPQHAISWRQPPYFFDVVPPLLDLGRGSPTGVVCYRHVQFPEAYRGGLFLLDWTFGRVWFVKLTPFGSTYKAEKQLFLEAIGENGFAPTAAAVHPLTGDLYLSIGGRGTRGAVYRIRHVEGLKTIRAEAAAALQPKPRSLDWQREWSAVLKRNATGGDLRERRIALELMQRHWDHLGGDHSAAVQENAGHSDRGLRQNAAALFTRLDAGAHFVFKNDDYGAYTTLLMVVSKSEANKTRDLCLINAGQLLHKEGVPLQARLDATRVIQVGLGDLTDPKKKGTVWEGYSRRRVTSEVPANVHVDLGLAFPANDADLDRELSRTLAIIEDDTSSTLAKVAAKLTADSSPIEDVHYLIVAARLRGKRTPEVTKRIADSLLSLDKKVTAQKLNRDTNWPLRVGEMLTELVHKDDKLAAAILAHPEFGRPDHAFLALTPGFDRRRAAEIFIARAAKDRDFAWNAAVIELIGELPPEKARPVLRIVWGEHGLDDAILPILAKTPDEADRARFLQATESGQAATVKVALTALETLPKRDNREETLTLIVALRRLPQGKEEDRIAERLAGYLATTTGATGLGTNRDAWSAWFAKKHPDLAKRLGGADGVDVEAWNKRLAAIDWNAGSAERGKATFTKASCATCHSGTQALGPDLRGIGGRFSRIDLFTAIVQPSKDVSPRYRTTRIDTGDGKVYQGIIVYEAVDSVILQTGPAATMRLVNKQIARREQTATSLMPVGLIDKLTDREIADLYAYLKELK